MDSWLFNLCRISRILSLSSPFTWGRLRNLSPLCKYKSDPFIIRGYKHERLICFIAFKLHWGCNGWTEPLKMRRLADAFLSLVINRKGGGQGFSVLVKDNCGGLDLHSQSGFMSIDAYYWVSLVLLSGATGLFLSRFSSWSDWPDWPSSFCLMWSDRTSVYWLSSVVRLDDDLACLSCLLCPIGQWPYWSAGLCCGVFVPWDYWSQAEQQSMERLWEVQCCSVHYSRNVRFWAWNDSSTCFWGHIYLWITSLCKYFTDFKVFCLQ